MPPEDEYAIIAIVACHVLALDLACGSGLSVGPLKPMAHIQKGALVKSPQWWKHLRPFLAASILEENTTSGEEIMRTLTDTPNFGAPAPGYIPWRPTEAETAAIKARGVITDAARWDSASAEERKLIRPAFNPQKRWFEQPENRAIKRI